MANQKSVIIYSANWCAYCGKVKKYLTKKGIDYIEKNIEEDETANEELMEKIGGAFRGLPVLDINGTILQGFDLPKIDAAIENLDKNSN